MILFEITSRMPNGTTILKFNNGYSFEGMLDANNYPTSGIIATPKDEKYEIPEFKEDIYTVFKLIEEGQLNNYKIKEDEQ